MKLVFGDIVVVEQDQIGVVVKSWAGDVPSVEVYVRNHRGIETYPVSQVERYQVRHKELSEEEVVWQTNAEREE